MIKISRRYAAHIFLSEVFCQVMPGAQWVGGGQSPRGFYSDFLLEQACPEDLTILLQEAWKRVVRKGAAFRSLEMLSHNLAAMLKSRGRPTAAEILLASPNQLVSVLQVGQSFGLAPLPHLLDIDEIGEVAILDAFFVLRQIPQVGDFRVLRVTGEVFDDVKEKKKYIKARALLEKQGDGISRARRFGFLEENHEDWGWRRGGVLLRQTLLTWWSKAHHEAGYDLAEVLGEGGSCDGLSLTNLNRSSSFAQMRPFLNEEAIEHLGVYDPKWGWKDEVCVVCCKDELTDWLRSALQLIDSVVKLLAIQVRSSLAESKRAMVDMCKLSDHPLLAMAEKGSAEGKVWRLDVFFLDALGALWPGSFIEVESLPKGKSGKEPSFLVRHALFGCLERVMALLLEKSLPLSLAPCQLLLLPLREQDKREALDYARRLREDGMRVEIELTTASLAERLSRAFSREIPMVAILGAKEQKKGALSVSFYGEEGELSVTVEELVKIFKHKQSTSLQVEQVL